MPSPNLFVFTGENSWAMQQELHRWTKEFREKHGEENLLRIEVRWATVSSLCDSIATAPFIASRRLVVFDGIPFAVTKKDEDDDQDDGSGKDDAREAMATVLRSQHPDVILLFAAPKPDKRLSVVKDLLKVATVKDFPPLVGEPLRRWMREELARSSASIAEDALSLLIDYVGEDQMPMAQELQKLSLFASGRQITRQDIETLVLPSAERNSWTLTNLLLEGHTQEAIRFTRGLLERGENPQKIWNANILWLITNLVAIAAAVQDGLHSPDAIASALDIKPGTVRFLLPLARRCSAASLSRLLDRIVDMDIGLKTGGYRATAESVQELEVLIDRSLLCIGEAAGG
ncbi:MAG: DNA polymerase III subunit delta [Candidatus Peregrinibacteria bacterium]